MMYDDFTFVDPEKLYYLAGPMRGWPRYNHDQFDEIEAAIGSNCVSPASFDRGWGFDPDKTLEENGFDLVETVENCVSRLLTCDAIILMQGWKESAGAKAEAAIAEWVGMPRYELSFLLVKGVKYFIGNDLAVRKLYERLAAITR